MDINESGYKRINHFNEFMAQKKAEGSVVPQFIIDDVTEEYVKHRKRIEDISDTLTLRYLKKLGYAKYYEQAPQISSRIKQQKPGKHSYFSKLNYLIRLVGSNTRRKN
jgi:hypothetical protein